MSTQDLHITNTAPSKVRDSNLELYRILVMFMIVMHHYVVNSGLMPLMGEDPLSPKSLFFYLFGMWGKTGINCFVLITGYYMCKSKISLRKFLKLLLEVETYEILIYIVFAIFGPNGFSIKEFAWYSLPVRVISTASFTDCYLVFFLFIPFLNILIGHLDKRNHVLLILYALAVYSIIGKNPISPMSMYYVSWFCVIYLIGSYLRLYPYLDRNLFFWRKSMLLAISISCVCVLGTIFFVSRFTLATSRDVVYYFVEDSNALLAVFVSVCVFMFFKNIHIKQNKLINTVGGGTFAILLIHDNLQVRLWLWNTFLNNQAVYPSNKVYIHAIVSVILIYVICSAIEFLRSKTIENPLIDFFQGLIGKLVSRFDSKYGTRKESDYTPV